MSLRNQICENVVSYKKRRKNRDFRHMIRKLEFSSRKRREGPEKSMQS